ncbi:Glycine cleavage system transcriptional activator [Bibersteinia trehalosi USDA-ARS-USMARC-188]|uniref:Glycine cleavage system transcriptional activator n=4 Tax=Bibersteinia trehalosi TaxID=47735 RepID=W0R8N3_BIBTR|nr:transcriptional regulator GcvA [Bibersteinia trehalosi]AGH38820.1 Glycine cleavage system transcriptional activator [Bibersteinia trehalosi USDA-ARS-USMARC-192]AHG81381.1 Glycine cleavage system transcriptional activator [Bibersteinia trehalosi USDA-ARS-USMARC-188]AHG83645.1 Glycine cleavage system transcriptional activator [Bibersteinia trehalosi USDA-ARS-USMARC-189]AHG86807.1 Glycine cleavage system transcriptional activator [Bibersteinia trehalosi USDA-ARS-USMARC-190]RRN04520.1 transcrip
MNNKKLPPLNALKAFESAARHLNFTKAAEELFVTQAAVSHQIKLLEDFLSIQLFHRRNRILELTESGLQYFEEIRPLLEQIAKATDKIRAKNNRQILTISVPQTFGMQWLVPRLNDFHEKFPDVEVRIKGVDQDEGQLGKEIDVAIYYGNGKWDNLESVCLAEAPLVILASPKYLAENPLNTPDDIIGKMLLHVFSRNKWKRTIEHFKLDDKIDVEEAGTMFSHTFMALQAAMHNQGVAIANKILAQHEIEQGNLIEPFPTGLIDEKTFYVVYPHQMAEVLKVQLFVEWITTEMAQSYPN